MELLAFFSMALLILSISYTLVFDKTQEAYDLKSRKAALEIGERIASEINTAMSEGDGYSKNITLPDKILGADYTVLIDSGNVFVKWRKKNAAARTIAENVSGTFFQGNNVLANRGGVIFVN